MRANNEFRHTRSPFIRRLLVEFGQVEVGGSRGEELGSGGSRFNVFIEDEFILVVISVNTLGLETSAECLLSLHDKEDGNHEKKRNSPLCGVHRFHTEDGVINTRGVSKEHLEDGNDGNGIPKRCVTLEDTGMNGTVVGETGRGSNRHGSEIESVESLGSLFTKVVSKTSGPEGCTDHGSSKDNSSEGNTKEQVTSNKTLSDPSWGDAHDTILSRLDSTDETKSDGTDKVRVKNLNGSQRSFLKSKSKTDKNGKTLRVVDRGIDEKNLTKVIPHNTSLTDSSHNGGKVIISQNHLGSLTGNIGSFFTHSNTHIGGLKGRCVIHTITSHTRNLSFGL
mmetsp:Transcript_20962/g.23493  ORF Transcript_20962/g.23493 Transcript_20962/m.23493 type:complete len:336 (+) Transcript_20962:111-1118(+)